MKNKILGIFVCMFLFLTAIPAVNSLNDRKITITVETSNTQSFLPRKWHEIQKLHASDGFSGDRFGFCYYDDDTAVISAISDDDNGDDSGSVYVFTLIENNWTQQQKLTASDGAAGDNFGDFISLSDNTILIGAPYDDDKGSNSGSAYVFNRFGTTWTQKAKISASDGAAGDNFGVCLSISGDTILIGAPYDDDKGTNSGSAYVFTRNGTTWTQQAKIYGSDTRRYDQFGQFVFLSGDTIFVVAPYDDDKGTDSGSVYVFTRTDSNWTQQQKLTASDGAAGDNFGDFISLSGNTMLIGVPYDDDKGSNSGSAYVFTRSGTTWTEQAKLLASDGANGDNFGVCLSISGNTALVGALNDDDKGTNSGSAYVFTRSGTTWTQQAKISASDGANGDTFGFAVSIYGINALIGSPLDDDSGDDSGSVYVFCQNLQPGPIIINGPTYGTAGTSYTYTFNSVDPDSDDVYYYIDWGDGNVEIWDGPHTSGIDINIAHTYKKRGIFTIEVKAKDTFGAESDWSKMVVNMPKNKAINRPFQNFIQTNTNLFPILQKIIYRFELL